MLTGAEIATLLGAATAAVSAVAAGRSNSRATRSEGTKVASGVQLAAQEQALGGLRNLVDELEQQLVRERARADQAEQDRGACEDELRELRRRNRTAATKRTAARRATE